MTELSLTLNISTDFPQVSLITWRIFLLLTDGDKDKEDIRRWTIGTDDAGGREKLLRTVRPGE